MPRGKKYSIRKEVCLGYVQWDIYHVGLRTRDDVLLLTVHDQKMLPMVRSMMESNGYVESVISKERIDNK